MALENILEELCNEGRQVKEEACQQRCMVKQKGRNQKDEICLSCTFNIAGGFSDQAIGRTRGWFKSILAGWSYGRFPQPQPWTPVTTASVYIDQTMGDG
jgi:hypothetical protein